MNRPVLVMGAVIAVIAVVIYFGIGVWLMPPPTVVIATRVEIPAGTRINDLPNEIFASVSLRGDRKLIGSFVSESDLVLIRQADGVVIQTISQFEPLRKSVIVSSANEAASRIPALKLDDPSLAIITIPASNAPDGIREGDKVDLILAIDDLMAPAAYGGLDNVADYDFSELVDPNTGLYISDLEATQNADAPPTPIPTSTPAYRAPLAKVIVHAGEVSHVVRERTISATSSDGGSQIVLGEILALEIIVPIESIEWISMAVEAGSLQVALLSPLIDDISGPTIGASLTDFLDAFYQDRETLNGGAAILNQPEQTQQPAAPASTPFAPPPEYTPTSQPQ